METCMKQACTSSLGESALQGPALRCPSCPALPKLFCLFVSNNVSGNKLRLSTVASGPLEPLEAFSLAWEAFHAQVGHSCRCFVLEDMRLALAERASQWQVLHAGHTPMCRTSSGS